MKLKEIKPGMVIHCKKDDEIKSISDCGFVGLLNGDITEYMKAECYVIIRHNGKADWTERTDIALSYGEITEFSDLIIPEMSAEEVLQICSEICNGGPCDECIIGEENCFAEPYSDKKKVIEICQKWKSDHEKKEPEIEWVYRVFGAENNGEKFFQTEEEAIKRCEELAKSQKSKQYARYERVCRVKAVE